MIIINDTKLKWNDLIPGDIIKRKDGMNDDISQNIIERLADKWGLKEND